MKETIMPLGEEHLSSVNYEKLSKDPKSYGEKMSEEEAVEILGKLLPRSEAKKLVLAVQEKVKNGEPVRAGANNSWIWQERLWKAFDSYLDHFKLIRQGTNRGLSGNDEYSR